MSFADPHEAFQRARSRLNTALAQAYRERDEALAKVRDADFMINLWKEQRDKWQAEIADLREGLEAHRGYIGTLLTRQRELFEERAALRQLVEDIELFHVLWDVRGASNGIYTTELKLEYDRAWNVLQERKEQLRSGEDETK